MYFEGVFLVLNWLGTVKRCIESDGLPLTSSTTGVLESNPTSPNTIQDGKFPM